MFKTYKLFHLKIIFSLAILSSLILQAHALQVVSVAPKNEANPNQVHRWLVKFDEAAIAFGDPKAAAPFTLTCSDAQAAKGNGHWISDREWAFEFNRELPVGTSCEAQAVSGFKPLKGSFVAPKTNPSFYIGGPYVQMIELNTDQSIDEQQFFIARLNAPATLESLQKHVWCQAEDIGEKIPIRFLNAKERKTLIELRSYQQYAAEEPLRIATFACNRTLTSGKKLSLIFEKGVSTPNGAESKSEKRFNYKVREPFTASFTCERENAQAACSPLRTMKLEFSSDITYRLAKAIRLEAVGNQKESRLPFFESSDLKDDDSISVITFQGVFPEKTSYQIVLPAHFVDSSGRTLRNLDQFPLKIKTALMPPLAKFSAAPFGILERLAEPKQAPLLPLTLRNVEQDLNIKNLPIGQNNSNQKDSNNSKDQNQNGKNQSQISQIQLQSDAQIIDWWFKVHRYHETQMDRKAAEKELGKKNLPKAIEIKDEDNYVRLFTKDYIETRTVSLLNDQPSVQKINLPPSNKDDLRPFEVIGVPLNPGVHVLEVASPKLGESLLHEDYGANRPMYVRTMALVTNLGIHFKLGRENSYAWVTTLDKGKPVENAAVQVSDCYGKVLMDGKTNQQGFVEFKKLGSERLGLQSNKCFNLLNDEEVSGWRYNNEVDAYFVSARAKASDGVEDMAFMWTSWNKGIEGWRFNVPTDQSAIPSEIAHTIFDRTLFRAGETVSMKHIFRTKSASDMGFALPKRELESIVIMHEGSYQKYEIPFKKRKTATGGFSVENQWKIPLAAKLGSYSVTVNYSLLPNEKNDSESDYFSVSLTTGSFRVEEFRLPVLTGQIHAVDSKALVNVKSIPTQVEIQYISGGAAVNLPVEVSALQRDFAVHFDDYDGFNFSSSNEVDYNAKVIADKKAVTLDKNGSAKLDIDLEGAVKSPKQLLWEATYSDPNGEIQTIRNTATLWPSAVVAGVKTESWVSVSQKLKLQALALDVKGKPQANTALEVRAQARITTTTRKRMIGGFYSYDHHTETKDLGSVCSGRSDAKGLLLCDVQLKEAGEMQLTVVAKDKDGNPSEASTSVWVSKQGDIWFNSEDGDRMDLLPEKKNYAVGETARFQVRMPFRFATAWLAVEREGIMHTEVIELNGQDPTIRLKIQENWGPNVYVSVLALRGRLRDVPWYSFFTWGLTSPREWWRAYWHESQDFELPTAMIDLSKPAFRLGLAEIRIGDSSHRMQVKVTTNKDNFAVRETAQVTISAKLPNGQPAANAEIALAAVDQALLELKPNTSWNLLEAMLERRFLGVETSTGQSEIIGRRHYGRKAVAAGGGGGKGQSRELFDTLLLWNPQVVLDNNGQATVKVPLNDALTTFQIVAVADSGLGFFGTGKTSIKTSQDLQIISGLPPLVREEDQFKAQITLRNTTKQAMKVEVNAKATLLELNAQKVDLPANESREIAWNVTAPNQTGQTRHESLAWEFSAKDVLNANEAAKDVLKIQQRIIPAIPLTVQQATIIQLGNAPNQTSASSEKEKSEKIDSKESNKDKDKAQNNPQNNQQNTYQLAVNAPANGLPAKGAKRGGLQLAMQPKLAHGLPSVIDWFERYPFVCLEQKTSKSVGLRDLSLWKTVTEQLPTYLDSDGLANYFPTNNERGNRGSDTLTAYLLAATHEVSALYPEYALSKEHIALLERGLTAFIEGRIERNFWSPRKDLDMRKLSAIEALSRYGKAQARWLTSINIAPEQWPTHAVIDWLQILQRVKDVPQRTERLAQAHQILKSRLSWSGTRATFTTEENDYWWWLMQNGDVNMARLILAVIDDPAWRDDMGRLINGFIGRQQNGAWHTTNANLWGGLALEKFSAKLESTPVSGTTHFTLDANKTQIDWSKVEEKSAAQLPKDSFGRSFGASPSFDKYTNNRAFLPWTDNKAELNVQHQGKGKPWLTIQSLAAVELKEPFNAGYQITKTIKPIEQAVKGRFSRGDILRITLEVQSNAEMTWVVLTDPIPSGATILGSGLGRDSEIATQDEKSDYWVAFQERSFEFFRSYYEYVYKGKFKTEYTIRLNNEGDFSLPPTRVEALYAPEVFGEIPNSRIKVEAAPLGAKNQSAK